MDYRFEGKRKAFSIGTYPNVSLLIAREKRNDARKLLNLGIDPNTAKKEAKRLEDKSDTFAMIARTWLEHRKPAIKADGHKRNVRMVESDLIRKRSINRIYIYRIESAKMLTSSIELE